MIDILCSWVSALPFAWAEYSFMQRALIAICILAPLFALPGSMVISSQMAFFSDAIGHAALTGIAIGTLLGMTEPFWAMMIFATLLSLGLSGLRRLGTQSTDTLIGIVMAGAVALGIVILSRGGGFARYSRYLIGDILSLTNRDIVAIGIGFVVFALIWALGANRLFLSTFNRPIAGSRGVPVWLYETIFSVLVALLVTAAVQWIGVLVINAFLILPAAAARNIARSTRSYVWLSVVFALIAGVSGLIVSFYISTASGATIVLASLCLYMTTLAFRNFNHSVIR